MRWALLVWLIVAVPVQAATERIGTWVLSCARAAQCTLAYDGTLIPMPNGMAADLEVQRRGDLLVPVIALRGLSSSAAIGSVVAGPAVSLAFDQGAPVALACGMASGAITCAPQDAGLSKAADALPAARSLTVRVSLNVAGTTGGMGDRSLDRTIAVTGTPEALAQLRTRGAAGDDVPVSPGLDLKGMVDRTLRAAGFRNGAGDLAPWLMKLIGGRS